MFIMVGGALRAYHTLRTPKLEGGTEVSEAVKPSGTVERGIRDSSPQGPLHGIHAIAALVNPFTSRVYGVSRKASPPPRPDSAQARSSPTATTDNPH